MSNAQGERKEDHHGAHGGTEKRIKRRLENVSQSAYGRQTDVFEPVVTGEKGGVSSGDRSVLCGRHEEPLRNGGARECSYHLRQLKKQPWLGFAAGLSS
jgi:hypothetical protein